MQPVIMMVYRTSVLTRTETVAAIKPSPVARYRTTKAGAHQEHQELHRREDSLHEGPGGRIAPESFFMGV